MLARAGFVLESLCVGAVLRFVVVLSSIACCASIASAAVLSGTFSGTAAGGTSFLSLPDGTPMTGIFKLDLNHPFVLSDTDGSTYAHYEASNFDVPPDPVHFTFAAPSLGYDWDYNGLGFLQVYLYQTANDQHISFGVAYPKGSGAEITLAGGPGTLFQSFDLASVHGGPLNTIDSFAHFDQTAGIGNDIIFSSVAFDAPVPMPEPRSGVLLLTGLGVFWATKRRTPCFVRTNRSIK
jgi:hypothetical protein